MAEGNYPFPSTYITFSINPGTPTPLPAWPMRVACEALDKDFGVRLRGSTADVRFNVSIGNLSAEVDWAAATGNGDTISAAEILTSGVLELASAVAAAAGVWYNLTGDVPCYDISPAEIASSAGEVTSSPAEIAPSPVELTSSAGITPRSNVCPACPPCDGCPPCPVSYCDWEDEADCSFTGTLSKGCARPATRPPHRRHTRQSSGRLVTAAWLPLNRLATQLLVGRHLLQRRPLPD